MATALKNVRLELENDGDESSVADDLRAIGEAIAELAAPEDSATVRHERGQHLERVRQALREAAPIATVEPDLLALHHIADLLALRRLLQPPAPASMVAHKLQAHIASSSPTHPHAGSETELDAARGGDAMRAGAAVAPRTLLATLSCRRQQ